MKNIRPLQHRGDNGSKLQKLNKKIIYLVILHFYLDKSLHKSFDFSLLSYNILAQELLEKNSFLYDWSDLEVLSWEYRRKLLLDEIKLFNADVSIT